MTIAYVELTVSISNLRLKDDIEVEELRAEVERIIQRYYYRMTGNLGMAPGDIGVAISAYSGVNENGENVSLRSDENNATDGGTEKIR